MAKRRYTKWTKEMVQEQASQHATVGDFYEKDNHAYMAARRQGWMDEVCSHMVSARFVWTDDLIRAEARKYNTRSDFAQNSRSAYSAAARKKIINEVCSHMPRYAGKGKIRGPNRRSTGKLPVTDSPEMGEV